MSSGIGVEVLKGITALGDQYIYMIIIPALYWFLGPKAGRNAFVAFFSAGILNIGLKSLFKVPRPPRSQWLVEASGYGFPSGHAMTSAAFWSSLWFSIRGRILPQQNSKKWFYLAITVCAVLVPLMVAVSRVALGVHTVADVAGGLFFGLITAFAVIYVLEYLEGFSAFLSPGQKIIYPLSIALFFFGLSTLFLGRDYNALYPIAKGCGAFFGFSVGYLFTDFRGFPTTHASGVIIIYALGLLMSTVVFFSLLPLEFLMNSPDYNLFSFFLRSALFAMSITLFYPAVVKRFRTD